MRGFGKIPRNFIWYFWGVAKYVGKCFANDNRGACESLSRWRLQLFVAPPLDPPDPRFQCCLDLCCALAKYFPLLTPSLLLGATLFSTLNSGGEGGGNRVGHPKRD